MKPKLTRPKKIEELSLNTVITEDHMYTRQVREFFGSINPKFYLTPHIRRYFKENVGKTYMDVIDEWFAEEERKEDPNYKKEVAPQSDYHKFIRDFYSDPQNKGKSRGEAVALWGKIKNQSGDNNLKPHN